MHERTAVRPARDRVEGHVPPGSRSTPEPAGSVTALSRTVGNLVSGAELADGVPLDTGTRADMEAGFGRDLGHVRLHTDGSAEEAVSAAGALACTVGRHIFLGRSGLRLGNTATRRLLAHELSHVVQQERGGIQDPAVGGAPEARAHEAADAVLSGRTAVDVGPGTQVGIARADAGQADGGGAGSSVIAAIGDALSSRLLGAVGLPAGSGVALSAMRGFAGELARQLFKDDKSAAILFLRRVATMSAGDFAQFGKGYVSGLVEGVVSPVTDLVGLAAFVEHLQKLGGQFLVSVLARRDGLGADFQQLVDKVKKLMPDWKGAWAKAKADPTATVLAVLGFGDRLRAGVDAMAYSLGKSGAKALTESLAEPFRPPQQQQETARPGVLGMILQPATTAVAAGRAVMDRIQNTPWAKVGGKFGYVVGSLVIQLVLLVFTEGLGNLIEQVAQKIGSLGAALGKLLSPVGKAVTRVAEFLGEVGRGVAAAEALLARLLSKVFQPLEKILGPVLKPLGEAVHELRTFLRKLFGVVEKDGVALLESAGAKAVPHPDVAPTPKPHPHGTPTLHQAPTPHGAPAPSKAAGPLGDPYRRPSPPVPEEPSFPTYEKPAKPAAPPAPAPVPDTPVTPDPAVHPPTRRRIDPGPFKEDPAGPPPRRPGFEIDPRFRKPDVPPRPPVLPEPVKAPPVPQKPPEPLPKPPEPLPKAPELPPGRAASPGESVLAPEPPVALPAGAEVSGSVPAPARSPALATVGDEAAGSTAAPLAGSGERPPVRASAEGGGSGGGGSSGGGGTSTPSETVAGAGNATSIPAAPAPKPSPAGAAPARTESVDEFLARGGQVRKLPPGAGPETPQVTAAPRTRPDDLSALGEGPEVNAVKPASRERAGIRSERPRPERGQVRPALPSGSASPRGKIFAFREGFADPHAAAAQKDLLELARTDPQLAGRHYENLVAGDIQGGADVQDTFTRPGRRMDIGTEHEVTIEGRAGALGENKLDQLWDDLVDKGNVTLTVPRLSPAARDQLERLAAQAEQLIPRSTLIVVRETLP